MEREQEEKKTHMNESDKEISVFNYNKSFFKQKQNYSEIIEARNTVRLTIKHACMNSVLIKIAKWLVFSLFSFPFSCCFPLSFEIFSLSRHRNDYFYCIAEC